MLTFRRLFFRDGATTLDERLLLFLTQNLDFATHPVVVGEDLVTLAQRLADFMVEQQQAHQREDGDHAAGDRTAWPYALGATPAVKSALLTCCP